MKHKEDEDLSIGLNLLALVLLVPGVILSGYVMTIMWGWFVTPMFGLAVPSIPLMIGFAMLLYYITYQSPNHTDERNVNQMAMAMIVHSALRPLFTLGIAYIVHLFV